MSRKDTLRRIDQGIAAAGGSSVSVTITGGSSGGTSNADTVDGYHASSTATAGKLLALDASAQFDPSVIEWADVAGAGLDDSGDTLVVLYGASPTTIVPDASTGAGSASTAARGDHTHAIAAAAATTLTVTTANAEGDATSFARSNHTHAITASANPGATASILASTSDGYLQLVRLGLGVAPTTALQVQGTTPQLRIQSDNSNYVTFGAGATGNLTITPSGTSVLFPAAKTLSSDNWASQTTGWGIYQEPTHSRAGYADFRYIYADELHVKAFIADLEQALAGGQLIAKSVAILSQDITIPAKGSTVTLKVEDLPGTTAAVFASGDWIRLRTIARHATTGALEVADAYGTVGAATLNGDGTQSYTFSRPVGDTGSASGTVVPKGGLAIDYGTSGAGFWEVTTLDTAGSPYAQVVTWATHPQTQTVRVRLGNLDGIAGIGAEWGLWAGKDATHYIKLTDTAAVLSGIAQTWLDGAGNARGSVDPTVTGTDALFWLGPSSGDKRLVVQADGVVLFGAVSSASVAGWAHASDLTKIDGGDIYTGSVTAAKLTVRGLNVVGNPGFETGFFSDWTDYGTGGQIFTSEPVTAHSGSCYLRGAGTGANVELCGQSVRVLPGRNYAASIWAMYVSATGGAAGGVLTWYDGAGSSISSVTFSGTLSGSWQRFTATAQSPSNAATALIRPYIAASVAAGIGVRFDDVEFYLADGQVVVGSPAGARVEINNSGIEGYSGASTRQFYLDATTGRGTFGEGKGILDRTGLMLSGAETSYNTFNAVRWLDGTLPSGNEVARLSAGKFFSDLPAVNVIANPAQAFTDSQMMVLAYGNATTKYGSVGASYLGSTGVASAGMTAYNSGPYMANVTVSSVSSAGAVDLSVTNGSTTYTTTFSSAGFITGGNRLASYTGTFSGTAGTYSLVAPGNGMYLLSACADDVNWRLIEWVRVRNTVVSSTGNVTTNYLTLTSSGGTIQIANSSTTAQAIRWCLIRLAN